MGKKYKHLNFIDRCHISAMNMKGMPQKEIAEKINVSPSTISTEKKQFSLNFRK
jgi:IS30 family transposase